MNLNISHGARDKGQKHQDVKAEHIKAEHIRHPKVLVVEDDVSFEPLWRKVFEEIDPAIQYRWCTDAAEAQAILEKTFQDGEYWDLIIADIFLAGPQTGLDLWEKCGEPVENMIIVSSVDYSKLLNFIDYPDTPPVYLKKPLHIKECVETLSDFLGGEF